MAGCLGGARAGPARGGAGASCAAQCRARGSASAGAAARRLGLRGSRRARPVPAPVSRVLVVDRDGTASRPPARAHRRARDRRERTLRRGLVPLRVSGRRGVEAGSGDALRASRRRGRAPAESVLRHPPSTSPGIRTSRRAASTRSCTTCVPARPKVAIRTPTSTAPPTSPRTPTCCCSARIRCDTGWRRGRRARRAEGAGGVRGAPAWIVRASVGRAAHGRRSGRRVTESPRTMPEQVDATQAADAVRRGSSRSTCRSSTRSPRTTRGGAGASPSGPTSRAPCRSSRAPSSRAVPPISATTTCACPRCAKSRPRSRAATASTGSASTTTGSTDAGCSSGRSTRSSRPAARRSRSASAGRTRTGPGAGTDRNPKCSCTRSTRADSDARFIEDVIPLFEDRRYIRFDGKPVLLVYRANILPEPRRTTEIWRERCQRHGLGDVHLVAAQTFGLERPAPARLRRGRRVSSARDRGASRTDSSRPHAGLRRQDLRLPDGVSTTRSRVRGSRIGCTAP